jgi:hypothetical protein
MGGKSNTFNKIGNSFGLTGSGGVFGGAASLGSGGKFAMTPEAAAAEQEAIAAMRAQASGQAPSIAAMQFQQNLDQAQMAQAQAAASARGMNPALAFRAASQASGQMQAEAAGQSAMMAEEERRRAREALIQAAAAQRGAALQGAAQNLQAKEAYRKQTFDFLGNLGGSAAKASSGGAGG